VAAPPEVWARAAWAVIDLAEMGGLPSEGLFEGAPFDATSVRKLSRVTWDEYCTLVENVGRLAGDGLDGLLEATYHQAVKTDRKRSDKLTHG
jgi:hypothetical protein